MELAGLEKHLEGTCMKGYCVEVEVDVLCVPLKAKPGQVDRKSCRSNARRKVQIQLWLKVVFAKWETDHLQCSLQL